MLQQPRLKANYLIDVIDGTGTFLLAEGKHFLITGRAVAELLPYLDGRHAVGEIVTAVADRVSPMDAFSALQRLAAGGHLVEGRPDLSDEELAYWDLQGMDAAAATTAHAAATLPVVAIGGAVEAVGTVRDALAEAGVATAVATVAEAVDSSDTSPVLVLTDDYLAEEFVALNDAFLATGRTWLVGKPAGRQLWLGPRIVPGETGCWSCLEQRVAGNRQVERYLSGKRNQVTPRHPSRGSNPAARHVFAGLLASEVQRVLATGSSARLDGTMVTVDVVTLDVEDHTLVRQPQCPSCGDPSLIAERSAKVTLESRRAVHTTDGGHRVQTPPETFERMKRHISPILGAVTTLALHDDSDNGITYSFTAGHNFAMVNDNIDLLKRNLRGQSGGKGRTEIQAKVSAVCEAVERYCAVWRGDEPVTRAAFAELDPSRAVHPDRLLRFSPAQVENRSAWNADPSHRLHLVPEPFDENRPIDWSTAWSLTDDTEQLIPAGLAWYGHPDLSQHFYCVSDSNGSASGNCLEEAVLQGFCEVAERDAVAIWWYNRVSRRAFDLDSLEDPYTRTLTAFYDRMDRDLWVLDLTTDLGIPTFAAVSKRRHEVQDVMVGFGSHPDARLAVMRALTEVNQFLPYVDQRDEHGCTIYRTDDLETLAWCKEATVESEPWLLPNGEAAATPADFEAPVGDDLAEHVVHCVDRARAIGVEVMVLDQSRPDLDLSVVKVVAPGLRHFWRRLGEGRLYDVPVAMGWQAAPTPEAELNPRSLFF